jgi:sterol desaturase/sphingolipid hydroxylase (fatty acid hydroxylase superfamily)
VFTSPFSRDELRSGRDGIVSGLPLGVQFLLFLAMADVIGYWSHRAFHRLAVLWKFHAVHHSSTNLDWLSSARVHPINDVANNVLLAAPLLFLGFAPAAFAAYVPFLTLYTIMLHANVSWTFGRLGKVIASPTYHRWHHSAEAEALNKNFSGLLPCIDILFGTFYMPKGVQPTEFGVVDQAVPDGFFGQMAHPFRRQKDAAPSSAAPAMTA